MSKLLHLQISLDKTDPLIWREILVSSDYTFYKLNHIIQVAMGWTNSHLFEFEIENYQIGVIYDETMEGNPQVNSIDIKLSELNLATGEKFRYLYDFGDYWNHTITVLNDNVLNTSSPIPYCLDGENNCPPEDCGGISGFKTLVSVLSNPTHEEYREYRQWAGRNYNATKFNINKTNKTLKNIDDYIRKMDKD